jgi:hypothetical protein
MDDETLRLLAEDLRKRTEALQLMISQRVGCDEVLDKLADLRQRLSKLPATPPPARPPVGPEPTGS